MAETLLGQQAEKEAVEVTIRTKDGVEHTTRVHLFELGDAKIAAAPSKKPDED